MRHANGRPREHRARGGFSRWHRAAEPLEGGRITVIVSGAEEVGVLVAAGFRRVMSWPAGQRVCDARRSQARLGSPAVALSFGRRECGEGDGLHIDQSAVEHVHRRGWVYSAV